VIQVSDYGKIHFTDTSESRETAKWISLATIAWCDIIISREKFCCIISHGSWKYEI